jgi:hypothetical protein
MNNRTYPHMYRYRSNTSYRQQNENWRTLTKSVVSLRKRGYSWEEIERIYSLTVKPNMNMLKIVILHQKRIEKDNEAQK